MASGAFGLGLTSLGLRGLWHGDASTSSTLSICGFRGGGLLGGRGVGIVAVVLSAAGHRTEVCLPLKPKP